MATWKRTPNTFDVYGARTKADEIDVTADPYCYYTDDAIRYEDVVLFSNTSPGSYSAKLTWERQGGPPPTGDVAVEYEVLVTEVVNPFNGNRHYRHDFYKKEGTPSNINQVTPVLLESRNYAPDTRIPAIAFSDSLTPFDDNNENGIPNCDPGRQKATQGYYDVTVVKTTDLGTPVVETVYTGVLEYRVVVQDNAGWDKTIIDNRTPEPQSAKFCGSILALPAGSSWKPGAPVTFRVERGPDGLQPNYGWIGNISTVLPDGWPKSTNGQLYDWLTFAWDGTYSGGFASGTYVQEVSEIYPIENGHFTFCRSTDTITAIAPPPCLPTEDEKRKRKDSCEDQEVPGPVNRKGQLSHAISLQTSWDGPTDGSVTMYNKSANSRKEPQSLGWGWGMTRDEFLSISDAGTELLYNYGGGQFEVWDINNGTYTAKFPHNYTTVVKEPNHSFTLTFKDKTKKSFRNFNARGKAPIDWEEDRNGNRVYHHHDSTGLYIGFSDAVDQNGFPSGRYTRFDVPAGQPTKMSLDLIVNNNIVASKETLFEYFIYNDEVPGAIRDRLAKITNPEWQKSFRYYTSGNRYGRLHQVLDNRNNIEVEYDYYNDDDGDRVKSVTTYYYDDSGAGQVLPEMTLNYSYGTEAGTGNSTILVTQIDEKDLSTPQRQKLLVYNSDLLPVRIEETIGTETNVTTMEYLDPVNPYRVTKRTHPNLRTESFAYNSRGNMTEYRVLHVEKGEEYVTTYDYLTSDPDMVEKVTQSTDYNPSSPGTNVTVHRDTSFVYDSKNNLKEVVHPADDLGNRRSTRFVLRNGVDVPETDGQVAAVIDRRWDGIDPLTKDDYTTTFTYYPNGNLQSTETSQGPGLHPSTKLTFEYDDFDNVIKTTDLLGNEWETVYDQMDRVIEQKDARGKSTTFHYEHIGAELTKYFLPPNMSASGTQSAQHYDTRLERYVDGRMTSFVHDYARRVVEVRSFDSSDDLITRAWYDYTGFSELKSLTRKILGNDKTMEWSYDQMGRAITAKDSLGRVTTRDYEPYCQEFLQATPRGLATRHTVDSMCRAQGLFSSERNYSYDYDELGRLVGITEETGSSDGAIYDDVSSRYDFSSYDSSNPPLTSRTWSFEYDHLDRMTKASYPDGEEILYEYGHEGELLEVTDADNKVTKYVYNNDLSVQKVVIERGGVDVGEFTYTYDAGGRMTKLTYPNGLEAHFDTGGATPQPGWNENGQLTHVRYLMNDGQNLTLIRSFSYDYDDTGNRIQMLESNGTSSQDIEWQYRYDWFDRLSQVRRGVGGATPDILREYVYDESDNRLYMDLYDPSSSLNNKTFWYTYKTMGSGIDTKYSDELSEILVASTAGERDPLNFSSLETFVHDDDGNMVSRATVTGTTSYTWDEFNSLAEVELDSGETTEHKYDPSFIREKMTKDNGEVVKSFYSGLPTLSENSSTAANSISYFGGHQLLGYEQNGNSFYFLTDGLSSVRAVIDSNGNEVAAFESDEFGNELSSTGSSPKTWVGGLGVHNDTPDTRLFYMRRRHYDPSIGRFLNRDPIGIQGGLNLYSYGMNNPVTYVDPDGLNPVVTAARIVIPAAVAEYLNPTIRQSNLLGPGTGGTVRYTSDGKLVILLNGDDSLSRADKINILANECAHYVDLRLRGNPDSLEFDDARFSEGMSDLLETLVGTFIPPNYPGLKAKQQRVRNTFGKYRIKHIVQAVEQVIFDAGMDHKLDPLGDRSPVNIKTGLPTDAR